MVFIIELSDFTTVSKPAPESHVFSREHQRADKADMGPKIWLEPHIVQNCHIIIIMFIILQDILLGQVCKSCTDMMIKLYIIVQKNSIKKCLISSLIEKVNSKINQFDFSKKIMNIHLYNANEVMLELNSSVKCNICDMKFNKRRELTKHKELSHKKSFSATVCSVCGKKWPTTKQLKSHLNSHNIKQCPYCFKMLKTHAHYNKHVRNHMRLRKEVNHDGDIVKNDFANGNIVNKLNKKTKDLEETVNTSGIFINKNDVLKGNLVNSNNKCEEKLSDIVQNESLRFSVEENPINESIFEHKIKMFEDNNKIYALNSNIVTDNNLKMNDIEVVVDNVVIKPLKQLAYSSGFTKKNIIKEKCNKTLDDTGNNIETCTDMETQFNSTIAKQYKDNDLGIGNKLLDSKKSDIQMLDIDYMESGQSFITKNKYESKIKKFYLCDRCSYKSITKINLEAHYNKMHLCVRPYICQICSKSFYRKSNLQEHLLIHNKIKNYICETCGNNFVSRKSLETHLKTHGVKKFHCDTCNKFYFHKHHLNEHIKRNHMEKLYNCMGCEKKYGLMKELKRHFMKMH